MEIEIREIEVEDYRELLDFMKKVKGETNFLLGYPDEVKLSYEDEKEHIKKVKSFETSNHFVAIKDNKIIGCTSFNGNTAIKLYEKFGFKLEGCIEDGIFDGENYVNLLVYGLKI